MLFIPRVPSRRKAAVLQDVTQEAKTLISRAEHVKQQVGIIELQPGDQQKKEVEDWLSKVEEIKTELQRIEKGVEDGISSSTKTIQDQIDQLREDIKKLLEMGGFADGLTLDNYASTSVSLAVSKLKGQKFAYNLRRILSLLDRGVDRIGVHGVGGVGKTTLATHIHDELQKKLKSSAGNVYWVTVSNDATVFDLQSKIAEAIHCRNILKVKDPKKRAGILRLELSEKKSSVLILDDVWRDIMLEEVGIPDGFQLLITTRSRDVCQRMECKQIVNVGCLSEEESWELFREILGGTYDILSQEGKDTASLISKKCAGLPLGIKVVAASMRGVNDIHEWRNALAELTDSTRRHQGLENEVFPSLKLSFDRLNDMLVQKCFLYCALYPEDYEFFKGRVEQAHYVSSKKQTTLIEAWIAEGLLEGLQSRQDQIDKAYVVLNKLLNACLLDPVARNGIRVKMHDLVREMAVKTGKEYHGYMTKAGQYREDSVLREPEWTEDLTKASMIGCGIEVVLRAVSPNCPNLTTLLLRENPITCISHDFLSQMKGLEVLDLSHTEIEILPKSISDMENLMTLLLNGCKKLKYVPSLAKLRKLRELGLRHCHMLQARPNFKGVKGVYLMLRKLRDLVLCNGSNFGALLEGMEGLTNLQLLDWDGVRIQLSGMNPTLSHLQELRLDPTFESIKGVDLMQLVCLKRLVGCKFSEMDDFGRYVSSQHYLQLNHYEFHVTHASLSISSKGSFYPSVSKSVQFHGWKSTELAVLPRDVRSVSFTRCDFGMTRSMDMIPCLQGVAGEIREIHLMSCDGIEFVWSSASSLCSSFPRLEILQLMLLKDLKGLQNGVVLPTPPSSLQHFRELHIYDCGEMLKKLFTPLMARDYFQNLEKLWIAGCKGLEEVIGASEEGDGANHDNADIEAAGDGSIPQQEHNLRQYLPNLKTLELGGISELKSICGNQLGTLSSVSIESITVVHCPKLKKLSLSLPALSGGQPSVPPRLDCIMASKEWWESLEWDSDETQCLLEPLLVVSI
ncbi:hypothetical protein Droror1_Dr00014196 [Drosera rotundifolia]